MCGFSIKTSRFGLTAVLASTLIFLCCNPALLADGPPAREYDNGLVRLNNPKPLLADYPEFVEPVHETVRYQAPLLVDDPGADLHVRAWRFSYNARGIVEMPNRLLAAR